MKRTLFTLAIIGLAAGYATAGISGVGEAWISGSWSQQVKQSGVGSFDLVGTKMYSAGDYFATPTHANFNKAGWAMISEGPEPITQAAFAGPSVTDITWTLHMDGAKSDPLGVEFFTFLEGDLLEHGLFSWSGSGWSWKDLGLDTNVTAADFTAPPAAVPAPGALLLASLGMGVVGSLRRRRSL